MRDLKFRAWDKIFKFYVGEDELYLGITFDGKFLIYKDEITDEVEFSKIDDYILEPSTGLKDKNGKEIYVGDIVRVEYRSRVYQVVYRQWDCSFMFKNDEDKEVINMFNGSPDNYEVIGNIHENPELLGR